MPTLVVTVRRGFPSEDAFLAGSSFSTMATTLCPFPYNRQIDRFIHSDAVTCFKDLSTSLPYCSLSWNQTLHEMITIKVRHEKL